jgi:hypothetical protein
MEKEIKYKNIPAFGVYCPTFEDATRLKEIAESNGWIYNNTFSRLDRTLWNEMSKDRCLYFSSNYEQKEFKNKPAFAISNCTSRLDLIKDAHKILQNLHLEAVEEPVRKTIKQSVTTATESEEYLFPGGEYDCYKKGQFVVTGEKYVLVVTEDSPSTKEHFSGMYVGGVYNTEEEYIPDICVPGATSDSFSKSVWKPVMGKLTFNCE